ncbi:hypothetical protein PMAYCL1PPCAC_26907, partial [Pristionchus mayeri]
DIRCVYTGIAIVGTDHGLICLHLETCECNTAKDPVGRLICDLSMRLEERDNMLEILKRELTSMQRKCEDLRRNSNRYFLGNLTSDSDETHCNKLVVEKKMDEKNIEKEKKESAKGEDSKLAQLEKKYRRMLLLVSK